VYPMRTMPLLILLMACSAMSVHPPAAAQSPEPPPAASCGPQGSSYTRTTLYFGLNRKTGTISEAQWRAFLRDQVTPRFPQGLTVWEAGGQWRRDDGNIIHERSKVLLLVHEDTPAVRSAIAAIIAGYKREYQQESVLWETARICAAF